MKVQIKPGNKIYLFFTLCFININIVKSQTHSNIGINFQNNLSWSQIKEKAKKENKYIFIDGFTTWCVPCRLMTNEIFSQRKVAEFFNGNFINVSLQLNVTKQDKQAVRRWYKDAKYIAKTYEIDSYPTFLFFNPNGDLVHKIIGRSTDANEFIANSKMALNPELQYNTLKKKYEAGKSSAKFLLSLINAARLANDLPGRRLFINDYLASQKNLLTDQNLNFIADATTKMSDPGFAILINYPAKIDSLAGKGKSLDIITSILFNEVVIPSIRTSGIIKDYGGGMIVYSGEIVRNVDWDKLKEKLDIKYSNFSQQTILASKTIYFGWLNDWIQYCQSVSSYISMFGDQLNNDKINSYAWTILANCQSQQCLDAAIGWSKKTLDDKSQVKPYYLYTYSDLLYKSGRKAESIKFLEQAISDLKEENKDLTLLLSKMKNNEKSW